MKALKVQRGLTWVTEATGVLSDVKIFRNNFFFPLGVCDPGLAHMRPLWSGGQQHEAA